MENQPISLSKPFLEGTSQIFVSNPKKGGGKFGEIFSGQKTGDFQKVANSGNDLQSRGKQMPPQSQDAQRSTARDFLDDDRNLREPVFVEPGRNSKTDPAKAGTEKIAKEGRPVSELYETDENTQGVGLETFVLTDADLAEEPAAELAAVSANSAPPTNAVVNGATEGSDDGIAELTSLMDGNYADPLEISTAEQVEMAALTTRPFTQPMTQAGDVETIVPSASAVTRGIGADQPPAAQQQTAATSSVSLQQAIATANQAEAKAKAEAESAAPIANSEKPGDVVPATSAGNLTADKMADLRQIQAYADNMVAKANDGSNGTSTSIDLAALNTRMDRTPATPPNALPPTTPHALNFTERGWEGAFGKNIQWMSANNIQSAQIRINPADLGPVKIDLSMKNDQLTLHLNATHHITRDTLEAALPRLRAELANQGFSDADINMASQNDSQQSGQQTSGDEASANEWYPMTNDGSNETSADVMPATSAGNLMSGSVSLLDTFA